MTNFQINDYLLTKECDELAADIFEDFKRDNDINPWDEIDDGDDSLHDRVSETADGHEWTIYNYKALMVCAHCDVNDGEAFLEDVGMPDSPTIHSLASLIVYGELRARIGAEIDNLVEAHNEAAEDIDDPSDEDEEGEDI